MLNTTVRLSVWASTLLGTFNEITIHGELNYDMTLAMGFDVVSVYENIRSEIPEENRVPMKDDQYYIFSDHTGKRSFLGKSWIKPNSIVELTDAQMNVTVKGSDLSKLKTVLAYSGFTIVNAEMVRS